MPHSLKGIAALIAVSALSTACTDVKESLPSRTATEQLLISSAADNAANRLKLELPPGKKAFVDVSNFEGSDAKYAASAIKESFLRQGIHLVSEKNDSDTIIEIRLGALSVDQSRTVVGIPPITLPGAITLPEASVYSSTENQAVAKFSAFAYDTKSGEMVASTDPAFGLSDEQSYRAMSVFSWRSSPRYAEEER
jgi:hypothetical protein